MEVGRAMRSSSKQKKSMGVAKAGNLKLMAKRIGIHFFGFEDMFRCYRDNENLKKHFGHMDTLKSLATFKALKTLINIFISVLHILY